MQNNKSQINYKRFSCQMVAIVLLAIIDQVLKIEAKEFLLKKAPVSIIPGFLGLRYAENTGAAFSFMSEQTVFLSVLTGILLISLILFLLFTKNKNKLYHIFLPLIIAGGIGNLIDRVLRGYVIDYLEFLFFNFAIFNFADILVSCGAVGLIVYLIYSLFEESKNKAGVLDEGV